MPLTGINWVQYNSPVSWEEALAIATAAGGTLIKSTYPPFHDGWLGALAEESPDDANQEHPSWTSAYRVDGVWAWGDGAPVEDHYFKNGGPLDALNDPNAPYVALTGGGLSDSYANTDIYNGVQQFLVQYETNSLQGTPYEDWFLDGGFGPGQVIRSGAGNDIIWNEWSSMENVFSTVAGGTVDAGDGDDNIAIFGPSTISDGAGRDIVESLFGIIKAALDGHDDHLHAEDGRLSYGAAILGITADGSNAWSAEIGNDEAFALEFVGGKGDDTISGYRRIQGGSGDDWLTPRERAEGGAGDDTLVANTTQRVELRGEAGDDTLIFYTEAKAGGGPGSDAFVFKNAVQVTINDLGAGEWVDLSALLSISINEAFDQGFLSSWIKGGYTYLAYDADGGGDELAALATFKGVFVNIGDYLVV